MAIQEPIIGIDLGTTNSEVAYYENGAPRLLKLNDDGIVPSCVAMNREGSIIVGREARNQYLVNPQATVCSIKRKMGKNERVRLGDEDYTPQEISAFILRSLKQRAEQLLGRQVSKAVITVPAYFTDAQRHATREAGQIAGLDVMRIINEPTAAALAYGAQKEDNQRILVYDLGGGTFDVSIVTIQNGVVEVMASTGDNHLGGDDFDERIVEHLVGVLQSEYKMKETADPVLRARLKRTAEAAKIELSDKPYTLIQEDHLGRVDGKPVHLKHEFSRTDFEAMIHEDLTKTMDAVSKALRDASLLPGAIDKILLVGGSTRIPLVSELLMEKLGKLPHSEIDPDLCVALGASIQGAIEMGQSVGSVLVDITPYTFGTATLDFPGGNPFIFVPLIMRNSKLPITKSEVFYTAVDNQEAVEIDVYQGEAPDVRDNILIGDFFFKGLSHVPAGNKIVLTFSLDVNGLLRVHAVEKRSGKDIHGVVENAMRSFDEAQIGEARSRIESQWSDGEVYDVEAEETEEGMEEGETDDEARDSIRTTVKRGREMMDKASEEDRQDIIDLIETIQDALDKDRIREALKACEELEDLLFYLE